jgi:glucose/arabinose dehydrogenase/mono/diheme cytochrome c family protein
MINIKKISYKKLVGLLSISFCFTLIYLLSQNYCYAEKYSKITTVLSTGEMLFTKNCSSCHAIKYETMGPPLGGITKLLSNKELVQFIKNPSKVIATGNARANNLMTRYKIVMPSFDYLTEEQIKAILSYINNETIKYNLKPFNTKFSSPLNANKHLVDPVKPSDLKIELEDYVKIPVIVPHVSRKGIATLRAHPSNNGALLVSDQMGVIYYVHDKKVSEFLDIRKIFKDFIVEPGIGSGLGSFAFHPDFLKNGLFYTTHTETYNKKSAINTVPFPDNVGVGLQWVLTEWKVNDVNDTVFTGVNREVFRLNTPTTAHGMQDINFVPNIEKGNQNYGMLYLGIGDGGSNNIKRPEFADHKKSLLGTIIRIDPLGRNSINKNYGIPSDNPFVSNTDPKVQKEIWAYGFRNPHRMCWDTESNIMLVADIGEANIEEVNIVKKGKNYGWSVLEGNYAINTKVDLKTVSKSNNVILNQYESPFGKYDHLDGKAISGGYVYKGPIKEIKNKYIFGDIVTGRLFYMNISKGLTDPAIYDLRIIANNKEMKLLELAKVKNANLRIGTNDFNGDLFIMTKDDGMIRKLSKAYYKKPLK